MKKTSFALASIFLLSSAVASASLAAEPCKMYLKLEGGYSFTNPTKATATVQTATGPNAKLSDVTAATATSKDISTGRFSGGLVGLGFGYNFTEQIRTDITVHYANLSNKASVNDLSNNTLFGINNKRPDFKVAANAYYELDSNGSFVPFIGIGIGADITKDKMTFNGGNLPIPTTDTTTTSVTASTGINADGSWKGGAGGTLVPQTALSYWYDFTPANGSTPASVSPAFNSDEARLIDKKFGSKTSFLYSAIVGLSYKLSDAMYIDCSYKLENMPHYTYNNISLVGQSLNPSNDWKKVQGAWEGTSGGLAAVTALKTKANIKNNFTLGLRVEF